MIVDCHAVLNYCSNPLLLHWYEVLCFSISVALLVQHDLNVENVLLVPNKLMMRKLFCIWNTKWLCVSVTVHLYCLLHTCYTILTCSVALHKEIKNKLKTSLTDLAHGRKTLIGHCIECHGLAQLHGLGLNKTMIHHHISHFGTLHDS